MRHQRCGSFYNGSLAEGCKHCINGSKMVLFITGKCRTNCFYCPISLKKKDCDVIYANEMKISSKNDIFKEIEMMRATGTGITGGDPLINIDRTLDVIKILKRQYGKSHHIHLYTSTIDPVKVKELVEVGLDEIRFHPKVSNWNIMETTKLEEISTMNIDIGVEVPVLPDYENELSSLLSYALRIGVGFVNLNELEFSEGNWSMMAGHGYEIKNDTSAAIAGSENLAFRMMEKYPELSIHFCSSSFKDGVQLRNRLVRRASCVAKEYDIITEDGTIIKGVAYPKDLDAAFLLLKDDFDVPDKLMLVDRERNRIEIASYVLEEIASDLPFECYEVEEYPTADRLEVERRPLN
ncbi:MAG: 4Fe-4S cluster-binding domain-containing protein [archaeon]|nr:4Fe-4S cluster-binding domain-containing protein [archaeon]